tara:strand:+ start:64 stop:339 length:276 start_codon:yes stop_codon:yes gene_type:complete
MSEEVNNTEVQEEAAPTVQLSLADLAAVVSIIDATTKRGAFEGAELETVGAVRNRFAAFVDAQRKVQEEAEGATATDEDGNDVAVEEVEES